MTTSWSRNPFWHLRYSENNVKTLHTHSKGGQGRSRWSIIRSQFSDRRNRQFGYARLLISSAELVSSILPSQLRQFVKLHLLLLIPLHVLLYSFGDCAHDPARFVIFAELAILCLFIILMFHILPIVGTCKITQTVSDMQLSSPEMPFRALCSSIGRYHLSSYLAALAETLPLSVQLVFLHQRFLSQHNPQSISLSLHCVRSGFLVISQPQASC